MRVCVCVSMHSAFCTVHQYTHKTGMDYYAATQPNSLITKYINWHQYCNFSEANCKLPDDGLVKPKHVGAFIVYFNVNFNILKQINCALVGLIMDWITSECTVQLWKKKNAFLSSYTHSNRPQVWKWGPYTLITSPSHTIGTARYEECIQMPYLM